MVVCGFSLEMFGSGYHTFAVNIEVDETVLDEQEKDNRRRKKRKRQVARFGFTNRNRRIKNGCAEMERKEKQSGSRTAF